MIDLGAGDGRYVLARARRDPGAFVVGVDANAAGMAEASGRASRPRTALPNALFVVAAAEALPGELAGFAQEVTVHFPWGSLLRGVLGRNDAVIEQIARVTALGGTLWVMVSLTERDGLPDLPLPGPAMAPGLAARYRRFGFRMVEARPVTPAEVAEARSSWARRLGAGGNRLAWAFRFRFEGPGGLPGAPGGSPDEVLLDPCPHDQGEVRERADVPAGVGPAPDHVGHPARLERAEVLPGEHGGGGGGRGPDALLG